MAKIEVVRGKKVEAGPLCKKPAKLPKDSTLGSQKLDSKGNRPLYDRVKPYLGVNFRNSIFGNLLRKAFNGEIHRWYIVNVFALVLASNGTLVCFSVAEVFDQQRIFSAKAETWAK